MSKAEVVETLLDGYVTNFPTLITTINLAPNTIVFPAGLMGNRLRTDSHSVLPHKDALQEYV